MAVRDVVWGDAEGSGFAALTWQVTGGNVTTGWQWQMDWSASGIPLEPGPNTVTVTAEDIDGLTTSATVTIDGPSTPATTSSGSPTPVPPAPRAPPGTGSSAPTVECSASTAPSTARLVGCDSSVRSWASLSTADHLGYWLVASDGGVFAFGDARYDGSLPALGIAPFGSPNGTHRLNAPIVGIVPSTGGDGYLMVASDGGVFAFGDASFAGSCDTIPEGCDGPIVAVVPDATGAGYWLITAEGSVYAFGDAPYEGGAGSGSVSPVTGATRTPDGGGYWILFADGNVDPFGDAVPLPAAAGTGPTNRAVAIMSTYDGRGCWVVTANGAVTALGDATPDGSMAGTNLNAPVTAASPS